MKNRTMPYASVGRSQKFSDKLAMGVEYDDHPGFKDRSRWRNDLHRVIFGNTTFWGRTFDVVLIMAIVLSVTVVMLESVQSIGGQAPNLFRAFEWVFTVTFTVEYVLRLIVAERSSRYARSFFGVIDLLAILPFFIVFFFDLGGLDLGCREIGTCDIGGPDPRCPGGGRPLAFEHPPGRIHEPVDVATTVGGPVSGQHGTHDVPPGLRLPIIQQGQDVVGHAEGPGNLPGLGDGPESAEGLETGDGTEQFGLGSRVGERPGGVATTDAGLLLAPVAVGGCHGIRVCLQGERPVGGEQLDQVWQVGDIGQVDPFRGPPIHHLGGPRPVGSEPELGLG